MNHLPPDLDQNLHGMTVVFLAMSVAPVLLMAVASFLGPLTPPPADGSQSPYQILRWVMWAFSLGVLAAMFAVHRQHSAAIAAESDLQLKLARLRARTVVVTALAEGAAILAGVVTMLEGKPLMALPGFLPLLVWIGVGFPTRERVVAELTGSANNLNSQYR